MFVLLKVQSAKQNDCPEKNQTALLLPQDIEVISKLKLLTAFLSFSRLRAKINNIVSHRFQN